MKVAVIGSRSFDDYPLLRDELNKIDITLLISGGAHGADTLAAHYAESHGIPYDIYKPNWKRFQRGAGHHRNKAMIDACDRVVCFWDGHSAGSQQAIDYAQSTHKPIEIIKFSPKKNSPS